MSESIAFFIPGAPPSPNAKQPTTRGRMASVKAQREKGYVFALKARNTLKLQPITGPARIRFEVHLVALRDPMVNLPASLKHVQDGVCAALLPLGDGPGTPYVWEPVTQVQVPRGRDGVWVRIETFDATAAAP